MNRRRIGFLVFEGVQALDVTGPMDAFAAAEASPGDPRSSCYELVTIGLTGKSVRTGSGLRLVPSHTFRDAPRLDTLLIPGGAGARDPGIGSKIGAWVRTHSPRIRRIAAVCTGVYALAASGLVDGRRVTTHWRFASDLRARYPSLTVDSSALYLRDGPFYTSGGITAGIDLSLALIEDDHGPGVALSVARDLVVYLKRSGDQAQFSEPLRFQVHSRERMGDVASWIAVNLHQDLSVESLAKRVHLGPKQFTRRFTEAFGSSPAVFVETLRLDEARRRLLDGRSSVARVAASTGFRSDDVFRRRFALRFGISPTAYRERFGTQALPIQEALS